MGIDSPGCFQTYWRVPESTVFKIPAEMPLTHAALIEPVAVANHAVNTIGRIEPNDEVVILGGGPIGLLVALTAHRVGACVTLVEISSQRKKIAESFGFKVLDPKNDDVNSYVREKTGGFGADAVFEVTSSQAGARLMTQIVRPRGRIVIVAMFHQVPEVDLLQFFKQELHMFGTRIYENNDFVEAIETVNKGKLPVQQFITEIHPLMDAPKIFEDLNNRKEVLKILFQP
jgi:threonine dehydrogenase-like Zn-dependent dehydrogenase